MSSPRRALFSSAFARAERGRRVTKRRSFLGSIGKPAGQRGDPVAGENGALALAHPRAATRPDSPARENGVEKKRGGERRERAHFSVHDASVDAAGTRASRAHQTPGDPPTGSPPTPGWVGPAPTSEGRAGSAPRRAKKQSAAARSGRSRCAGPDRHASLARLQAPAALARTALLELGTRALGGVERRDNGPLAVPVCSRGGSLRWPVCRLCVRAPPVCRCSVECRSPCGALRPPLAPFNLQAKLGPTQHSDSCAIDN